MIDGTAPDGLTARSTAAQAATRGSVTSRARPRTHQRIDPNDYFGRQPASARDLPDPRPLIENLSRCVIEVLAGARELEQLMRWVSDDVYRHLLRRVVLSARARQARGERPVRPAIVLGSVLICSPRDGVVEATVIVHGRGRTRAVALRLEGLDRRWRATAIHVL